MRVRDHGTRGLRGIAVPDVVRQEREPQVR
jgi:hypothetical protein